MKKNIGFVRALCRCHCYWRQWLRTDRYTEAQHRYRKCKPYPSAGEEDVIASEGESQRMLKDMIEKKVISPSKSPWASPIVLVQKRYGSTQFCVDYRKINEVTRKDAYPIPRIDETLDTLAGETLFSTLDLRSGYWQVEMDPTDRKKTAFCTPEGLLEFNVMPFGLCNAPATFQRLMDSVLAGLHWKSCLVYVH